MRLSYDGLLHVVQAVLQNMSQRIEAMEKQHLLDMQQQKDLLQAVLLSQSRQFTLSNGSMALQLQMYKEHVQGSRQYSSKCLPLKRPADEAAADVQPMSQCAQRRMKQEATWQKKAHKREVLAQQNAAQQLAGESVSDPAASGSQPSGDASLPLPAGQPLQRVSVNPAPHSEGHQPTPDESSVQPGGHRQDIPGDGRGPPWQEWHGAYPTLKGTFTQTLSRLMHPQAQMICCRFAATHCDIKISLCQTLKHCV